MSGRGYGVDKAVMTVEQGRNSKQLTMPIRSETEAGAVLGRSRTL